MVELSKKICYDCGKITTIQVNFEHLIYVPQMSCTGSMTLARWLTYMDLPLFASFL